MSEPKPAVLFDSLRVQAIIEEAYALIWATKGELDTDALAWITTQKIIAAVEEDSGRLILK